MQAVGIALVAHRPDIVRRVISSASDKELLEWAFQLVIREGIAHEYGRVYRDEVGIPPLAVRQKELTLRTVAPAALCRLAQSVQAAEPVCYLTMLPCSQQRRTCIAAAA